MGLTLLPTAGLADSLRLTQIDASRMIVNQTVRLFISVTDEYGMAIKDLTEDSFKIRERTHLSEFEPVNGPRGTTG